MDRCHVIVIFEGIVVHLKPKYLLSFSDCRGLLAPRGLYPFKCTATSSFSVFMNCSIQQYFIPAEGRLNAISPSQCCCLLSVHLSRRNWVLSVLLAQSPSGMVSFQLCFCRWPGNSCRPVFPQGGRCVCVYVFMRGEREKKSREEKGRRMGTGDLEDGARQMYRRGPGPRPSLF